MAPIIATARIATARIARTGIIVCGLLGAALGLRVALAQGPIPGEQALDTTKDDLKTLQALGLGTDGPALLDYFRKRTFKEANPEQVAAYIKQLGSEDFVLREKAFTGLATLGPSAMVGLKEAEDHKDTEVKQRVRDLRERLEAKADPQVQAATARLVGKLKPDGSAEVLLAYLPFAADLSVANEICRALGDVAVQGKAPDMAVVKMLRGMLGDKLPIKRAAAAEALVRAKVKSDLPEVRKLLKDPEPTVRLRVGLALVANQEKEALPVLVALLNDLPPEQMWPVEEILIRLAGDATPPVSLGTTEDSRRVAFDAWNDWLTKNAAKIDLAKLDEIPPLLGHTVVVQQQIRANVGGRVAGEIKELDKDKNELWKFEVASYPVDAQVFKENGELRVLVAEFQANQVTIRDPKKNGNVIRSISVGGNPIGAQRLPNGNIFVVMQNRLVEYDAKGATVFTHNRPNHDVFRARKLPTGEVAFITNQGAYQRIDGKTQAVRKSFQVAPIPVLFGNMDVLPNGNVIVPDFQQNRVVEYNAEGKQVHQINVQWPNSATRLPNGNTLVASQNTRKVIEFNRGGQIVWEYNADGMVFNARRR
jgi:HEAT repeat protein